MMKASRLVALFALLAATTFASTSASSRPALLSSTCPTALSLRGGAGRRKHKAVHLHDIARNDSENEYFAGGQDDQGGGSATVLIYPDEDKFNSTEPPPPPPPPPPKFTGSGRQL